MASNCLLARTVGIQTGHVQPSLLAQATAIYWQQAAAITTVSS